MVYAECVNRSQRVNIKYYSILLNLVRFIITYLSYISALVVLVY